MTQENNKAISISDEVRQAILDAKPVVGMESTIISFGLPWPENYETALECEEIVRKEGCVPATIGITGGLLKAGLSKTELKDFATRDDIIKVNLSNMAPVCALGKWGATCVSASVKACHLAGIKVFATGGIGGVHKGFSETFDISSDLTALAQFPVIVISSGVKSILDIPATIERLETLGIPVIGYQTETFPAFYSPQSPCLVDHRINTAKEAAWILHTSKLQKSETAILVTVPVPRNSGIPFEEVQKLVSEGEVIMKNMNINGRQITPFLLEFIKEKTQGRSLKANLALIRNNVRVASEIAKQAV